MDVITFVVLGTILVILGEVGRLRIRWYDNLGTRDDYQKGWDRVARPLVPVWHAAGLILLGLAAVFAVVHRVQ